jgi:hypothetical protein
MVPSRWRETHSSAINELREKVQSRIYKVRTGEDAAERCCTSRFAV